MRLRGTSLEVLAKGSLMTVTSEPDPADDPDVREEVQRAKQGLEDIGPSAGPVRREPDKRPEIGDQ